MSNLKISQLTAATELQGDENIVVVQGAVTKQSTVQNIVNYIVPTNLTVLEGTTVNLSDSAYATSELIELSWSGSNGTMVLNLPLAASNVNRVMRFISNTGFGAGTQNADLTPQGGDTLDGSTNKYRINKAYEGIQVWSNGVEWFIIQKKA
jgi:hypothetical protein|tara:strand:+ start:2171 stop:2623 length:453 start_codon:yes stop_codon:yes gene_type:complete